MWDQQPPLERFIAQLDQATAMAQGGQYPKAVALYEESLVQAGQAKLMLPVEYILTTWSNLAQCHFHMDSYDKSLQYSKGTIELLTEWIKANEPGKNTGAELSRNKSAPAWEALLPDGVTFGIPQGFDPLPFLAEALALAGSASNFARRQDSALDFFKQAMSVYMRMNQPAHVARLWGYIASVHAERQDWDEATTAATRGLKLSQQLKLLPQELLAARILADVGVARGEYIKALRALTHTITLARQARDPEVEIDLQKLNWLLDTMRKQAEAMQDAGILKAVVEAERRLKHPDLEKDERLLAQLANQAAQPASSAADGALRSLRDVAQVVEQFARKHCGPPVKDPLNWSIGMEQMDEMMKVGGELVKTPQVMGVMLYLSKSPESLVRITLTEEGCKTVVMHEYKMEYQPGKFGMALKGGKALMSPPRAEALMQALDSLVESGMLVRQGNRLVYVGPQ